MRCPPGTRTNLIVGGVVGGGVYSSGCLNLDSLILFRLVVAGIVLIAMLVMWCKRRRNAGRSATRTLDVPVMSSQDSREYKHLDDSSSEFTSESKIRNV